MNKKLQQNNYSPQEEHYLHNSSLFTQPNILQSYLITVKQLTGAATATLFLQSESIRRDSALILHEGNLPPIPELKNTNAAEDFISKTHKQTANQSVSLFECASSDDGYILRISMAEFVSMRQLNSASIQRRKLDTIRFNPKVNEFVWLGLRYEQGSVSCAPNDIKNQISHSLSDQTLFNAHNSLVYILALGGYMTWQHYKYLCALQDPVSHLPGRMELQAYLKNMLEEALSKNQPLALLFINPDEFGVINQSAGNKNADRVLSEISEQLAGCLRHSDTLFRYVGAIFTVVLPHTTDNDARNIAEKVRITLTEHTFFESTKLTFSLGISVYQANEKENTILDTTGFLAQAGQALNQAKFSGGGSVIEWKSGGNFIFPSSFDSLSGLFTGDTKKDYRNMQLLWESIDVISSASASEVIAIEFVNRITCAFKATTVALFVNGESNNKPQLIAHSSSSNHYGASKNKIKIELSPQQLLLLETAEKTKCLERVSFTDNSSTTPKAVLAYAVPLIVGQKYIGSLYLDGMESALKLDSSDFIFLNVLATQIALTLDRAKLAMQWKQEKECESQKLRAEVHELRQFMKNARLVYRSTQMESILETVRTIAPTDITILITGESGTGKEVLAQTIHECSDRKNKPLITVDCGAISQNLIESELFGHVKGAYTGAQNASEGRILQADGGTLLLDEIGELPRDVQVKLLRFVQEKQITPLGSNKTRQVDVRILAATNRNLADEVEAGRFRGDLYFRLKVVTINSPALRERQEDILPLAQHFLAKFSTQYQKGQLRFSTDAENALRDYHWPGNVRELQNTIIRAVVLSNNEQISEQDLQFSERVERISNDFGLSSSVGGVVSLYANAPPSTMTAFEANTETIDVWQELRYILEQQVVDAIRFNNRVPLPLGRWLYEDLILAADKVANGNVRQAAIKIGLAETTFRRQVDKVKTLAQSGLLVRSPSWSALFPVLNAIISPINIENQQDIIGLTRVMLLELVSNMLPQEHKKGAALMGVSGPTYQRLLGSLAVPTIKKQDGMDDSARNSLFH